MFTTLFLAIIIMLFNVGIVAALTRPYTDLFCECKDTVWPGEEIKRSKFH